MPFYVAAPLSTIDLGARLPARDIPIEERDPAEVGARRADAPARATAAFDVTPADARSRRSSPSAACCARPTAHRLPRRWRAPVADPAEAVEGARG